MDEFNPARFLVWYLVFVFSTTCHEAAHAFVAKRGGDDTAYAHGHVTLDPFPHIRREPFGMVLVPILSFLSFGWMVGWASVPYDPYWGQRFPRRWALMSLAGPGANFLLVLLSVATIHILSAVGVFHLTDQGGTTVGMVQLAAGHDFSSPLGALAGALSVMVQLNLILGLYNLIPIPPLDGAAVVEGFGPSGVRAVYARFRQNPMFQMLGLLAVWWIFPSLLTPLLVFIVRGLLY